MASICDDGNGLKRIQFVGSDGNRRAVRLGKASMKQAEAFKVRLEALIGQSITGAVDDETSRWVAAMPDAMNGRLAAVGLVKARSRTAATLGTFLSDYFTSLNVKAGTATAYGHTRRCLMEFFGESKPLRDVESADADKWRQSLKAAGLSEATTARRVGVARMIFGKAVKWKLIAENPFTDVKAGSQTNKSRQFFITRDVASAVLEACPDVQWRLLFALSRYGGLRCPSEHLALKWGDVDFEHNRIRVPSPKTEHHEGGDSRMIPLFPELRPLLLEAFEQAEPGTEYVITRCRDASVNLRTHLQRIIRKAGLTPWPKLWHNLRASRQTELANAYPIHVVCQWIGNSRAVAQEHYLQVTDSHFAQAAKEPSEKAAHNPAQSTAVRVGMGEESPNPTNENRPEFPSDTSSYRYLTNNQLGAVGFEPTKA